VANQSKLLSFGSIHAYIGMANPLNKNLGLEKYGST